MESSVFGSFLLFADENYPKLYIVRESQSIEMRIDERYSRRKSHVEIVGEIFSGIGIFVAKF